LFGGTRALFQHPARLDVDQLGGVVGKGVGADFLAVGAFGHGQVLAVNLADFDAQFGGELGHLRSPWG
jgi:hypothetical protein